MKIVFTGGGTGGHFYPLIAIAEAVHDIVAEQKLLPPTLYYLADKPYDEEVLFANDIIFLKAPAGKMRRYSSLANVTDIFVTGIGIIKCFFLLLTLYPDVVVSKGGYASVPATVAARILGIPVIIHESDAKPGRANLLAGKWAVRIAVTFESARAFFPQKVWDRVVKIGIPVRKELLAASPEGAAEELGLDPNVPTVLILGGSTGSQRINDLVLDALPDIVSFANVIHQTGKAHYDDVHGRSHVILTAKPFAARYHAFPYLNAQSMARAAGIANVVVSRAGSTAITEIALWGKPVILIPIPEKVSHDQRSNAYAYAHTGAATVIEETNLTSHVLASEMRRIATDVTVAATMSAHAAGFADPNAARLMANEVLQVCLSHEEKKG